MSAKFPRGGGGAGPFLARSLKLLVLNFYSSGVLVKLNYMSALILWCSEFSIVGGTIWIHVGFILSFHLQLKI